MWTRKAGAFPLGTWRRGLGIRRFRPIFPPPPQDFPPPVQSTYSRTPSRTMADGDEDIFLAETAKPSQTRRRLQKRQEPAPVETAADAEEEATSDAFPFPVVVSPNRLDKKPASRKPRGPSAVVNAPVRPDPVAPPSSLDSFVFGRKENKAEMTSTNNAAKKARAASPMQENETPSGNTSSHAFTQSTGDAPVAPSQDTGAAWLHTLHTEHTLLTLKLPLLVSLRASCSAAVRRYPGRHLRRSKTQRPLGVLL